MIREQREHQALFQRQIGNKHMFQLIKLDVELTMTATPQHKKSRFLCVAYCTYYGLSTQTNKCAHYSQSYIVLINVTTACFGDDGGLTTKTCMGDTD
jgi:arginine/lysine/ornithine decarboxylase